MRPTSMWKYFWVYALTQTITANVYAETITDPCGGPSALLSLIDRPSVADSACVVPFGKVVLETGYQYVQLSQSAGYLQNLPEAVFRLGLPANNEFVILLPNYYHQTMPPRAGFSATTVGMKHEIGYNRHWLGAVEALFTLPTGSAGFGSNGLSTAFNGIVSYTFNEVLNLTFMLGITSTTESSYDGGGRYTSINPDLILTYSANPQLDFYVEFYGQSKTSPRDASGFNCDGGIIYLPHPKLALDLELGQRLTGNLGGFNHYIGAGMSMMFG